MPRYKVTVTVKGVIPTVLEDVIPADNEQIAISAVKGIVVLVHNLKIADCTFKAVLDER